jgi:DNA-binding transcriptional ArsR family regulator
VAITVDIGVRELAATRFAVSPLSETASGLQLLGRGSRDSAVQPWLTWARAELRRTGFLLPVAWPLLVTKRMSYPEFLLPSPRGPEPTIEDELADMRRTRAAQVRASLSRVFGPDVPDDVARVAQQPAAMLRRISDELLAAHDLLIAPHWPRLRAVLLSDVGYRARQLAIGGAGRLFDDLCGDVRWESGRLTLLRRDQDRAVSLGSRGLVLMPTVLTDRYARIKLSSVTQITLRYPARGAATIWTAGLSEPPASAVRLIGRPRAKLLEALRAPATTGGLARSLGVTPGAVSQHLTVLRDSGLVSTQRSGRRAVHLITDLGAALLDA